MSMLKTQTALLYLKVVNSNLSTSIPSINTKDSLVKLSNVTSDKYYQLQNSKLPIATLLLAGNKKT